MDIAGHVSRHMLEHYSHIRMEAKRDALNVVGKKHEEGQGRAKAEDAKGAQNCSAEGADAQKLKESPYKVLQSADAYKTRPLLASKKRGAASGPLAACGRALVLSAYQRGNSACKRGFTPFGPVSVNNQSV